MAKKPTEPEKTPEDIALEEHVDEMMSVEKRRDSDVSRLAEDVNKQMTLADSQPEKIEVKTSAPDLPKDRADPLLTLDSEEPAQIETASNSQEAESADKLEDAKTDEAVDDIVAKEGDTVLAVEDAKRKRAAGGQTTIGWNAKLKALFKNKWTWAALSVVLIVIFAIPFTRYKVLGLVIKKQVTITIIDSKTSSPVSNAEVQLGGKSVKSDEAGQAKVSSGLGDHVLTVSKKYYIDYSGNYFVGFNSKDGHSIKLTATGRLVPITVTNKITGKPIVGAQIEIKGTTAKTNNKGRAEVALPVKEESYKGKLTLSGYNYADISVQVTDKVVKANNFGLTPVGKIYFLSNLNGTLDVVKSNLDGSGRKVVLEGTGSEQPSATSLLASRDWRYLVLKARRDTSQAALYLIDTSNDKVVPFDNAGADFSLIGWYGHSFMYSLSKNNMQVWQSGRQIVKSYDAEHQQLNQLDQNQAEGSQAGYADQEFSNFYILNGVLSYTTQWFGYPANTTGKNNTVRAVQPNGQNKKDYLSLPAANTGFSEAALYEPEAVYYGVYDNTDGKTKYYEFENLTVKPATIGQAAFDQGYPTFLLSPSGSRTFWSELRDGKNALFVGGGNADNKKQIASLSEYSPYGWYSDNYLLVSKNGSELFVISPAAPGEPPLKITDYYKPAQTYKGYGYGYGGL